MSCPIIDKERKERARYVIIHLQVIFGKFLFLRPMNILNEDIPTISNGFAIAKAAFVLYFSFLEYILTALMLLGFFLLLFFFSRKKSSKCRTVEASHAYNCRYSKRADKKKKWTMRISFLFIFFLKRAYKMHGLSPFILTSLFFFRATTIASIYLSVFCAYFY